MPGTLPDPAALADPEAGSDPVARGHPLPHPERSAAEPEAAAVAHTQAATYVYEF